MFSSDPVVSVREAEILQDHSVVLTEVSFNIDKGEFLFIVGRTGSGKSSLLKTLYADLPLRQGEISVAGFNIHSIKSNQVPMLRRKIGIIFQDFQLFPDRNVSENLMFVMKATGWTDNVKMKARCSPCPLFSIGPVYPCSVSATSAIGSATCNSSGGLQLKSTRESL